MAVVVTPPAGPCLLCVRVAGGEREREREREGGGGGANLLFPDDPETV